MDPQTHPAKPEGPPDAVEIPAGWRSPTPGGSALDAQMNYLEPVLGGRRGQGVRRDLAGGRRLVTLDPADSLLHPADHPEAGTPRYEWFDQPDGTRHGFLKKADPQK
jgi:hypothetical protein